MNESEIIRFVEGLTLYEKATIRRELGRREHRGLPPKGNGVSHLATIIDVFRLFPWPSRPVLPILSQVWFDGAVIRTSDLCAHLSMPMPGPACGPTGTIEWRQLRAYRRGNITGAGEGSFQLDTGAYVHVEMLESPDALPPVPHLTKVRWIGKLTADQVRSLCAQAENAASTDYRPVLQGVYLEADGDSLEATAADGARLGTVEMLTIGTGKGSVIMPAKYCKVLANIGAYGPTDVSICAPSKHHPGGQVEFRTQVATLTIDGIEGKYPDYPAVISAVEKCSPVWAGVVPVAFLKRVGIECPVNCGIDKLVRMTGTPGQLVMETKAGHQWHIEDTSFDGGAVVCVNPSALSSLARTSGADVVNVKASSATEPITLRVGPWLGIIMPMNLSRSEWNDAEA